MRYALVFLVMLFGALSPAAAQVSVQIGTPNLSIGINVPVYPQFTQVPGYPVYYAPRLHANYFFYDGAYWVYRDDRWYVSTWYNGPWAYVDPYDVPLFILRVPVRYYRDPPRYFHGWQRTAPPRWGEHWGRDWEQRRSGWNHWDRKSAPRAAPLPQYQRKYAGEHYPHEQQHQRQLETEHYRYQPHDPQVRQHYEQRGQAPAPKKGHGQKDDRGPPSDRGQGDDRGRGRGN
jgi:hypothetical protein